MIAAISKWGNSHAVRLPKNIMQAANLSSSDKLDITVDENKIITLRPVKSKAEQFMEMYGDYKGNWRVAEEFDATDIGGEVIT